MLEQVGVHHPAPSVAFLGLSAAQWSIVGSVATAAGILVAGSAALIALRQFGHARRIHRDQTRPYMIATIEPGQASRHILDLVIRNIGTTPAYDLTIKIDPEPERAQEGLGHRRFCDAAMFARPVAMWAPGFEFRQLFDSSISRHQERLRRAADPNAAPLVDQFEITFSYSNTPASNRRHRWQRKPKRWEEAQAIDSAFGTDTLFTQVLTTHDAVQALQKIRDTLASAALGGTKHVITEEYEANRKRVEREQAQRLEDLAQLEATFLPAASRPDPESPPAAADSI